MAAHAAAAPHPERMPARDVAAVVVGNGLEFYDFVAYAFFALELGAALLGLASMSLLGESAPVRQAPAPLAPRAGSAT